MRIDNAPREGINRIAEELALVILNGNGGKDTDSDKILLRPNKESDHLRALKPAPEGGIQKKSRKYGVCLHGYYAFMARVFAAYPEAVIKTFIAPWTYRSFQAAALEWTHKEAEDRVRFETCECSSELVADLLRTPDELAQAGRITHWRSTPPGRCARKDARVDRRTSYSLTGSGLATTITYSGEADHLRNVTCGACRIAIKEAGGRRPRARAAKGAA